MTGKKKFISPVFWVCILLLAGCSENAKINKVAETPVEEKKAKLLRKIDRKFENPDTHYQLGKLYQADGLWAQAENQYSIALDFDPVNRDAQAARIKVLLDSGDKPKAELLADEYMSQAYHSAVASLRLGLAFQKELLDDYALACYQQALRLAPNSARINRQIGYYYLSRGQKTQATDYLTRSFQLDPRQPEVAGELGRLGVAVRIPRKTTNKTKKLNEIVDQADK